MSVPKIKLGKVRAGSAAVRTWAAQHGYDTFAASKAYNDTIRYGANNFASPGAIEDAIEGTITWLGRSGNDLPKTGTPTKVNPNTAGFIDDFGSNMTYLLAQKATGKPVPQDFKIDRIPKGTLVSDVAKKRATRSAKYGPRG